MSYQIPEYQRRMMGQPPEPQWRAVSSSFNGSMLTVGTRVTTAPTSRQRRLTHGIEGIVVTITEGLDRDVLVRWRPGAIDEQTKWHRGENLQRLGKAAR